MAYQFKKGDIRLPLVRTEEDVDKLTWLTDDEKEFGKKNLAKIPKTEGWMMLGNDPYTQAFWQFIERMNTALENDKGQHHMQCTPFCYLNICHMIVAKRSGNEYMLGCLGSSTIDGIAGYQSKNGHEKMLLIDHPECSLFNDEERLAIKFVNALYDDDVSDELFQEALDMWGEQMTIRHMSWYCYVRSWVTILSVLGMKFDESMIFPTGTWTPDSVTLVTDNLQNTEPMFADFWGTLADFKQ